MSDRPEGALGEEAARERTSGQKPLDPAVFARYALHGRREILQLLHALIDRRVLLTAQVDGGPTFLTLALATPDDGAIVLDAAGDDAMNRRVAQSAELVCMARLDNVRVQFSLQTPAAVEHDGRPALRAALPESLLRLQRREFFRLQTPRTAAPTCAITTTGAAGERTTITATVLDISAGGVAVLLVPEDSSFATGAEFDDCVLELPDGPLPVRLRVCNLSEIPRPNGKTVRRAGCEFVGQTNAAAARIQRYIFKVERDLKARGSRY